MFVQQAGMFHHMLKVQPYLPIWAEKVFQEANSKKQAQRTGPAPIQRQPMKQALQPFRGPTVVFRVRSTTLEFFAHGGRSTLLITYHGLLAWVLIVVVCIAPTRRNTLAFLFAAWGIYDLFDDLEYGACPMRFLKNGKMRWIACIYGNIRIAFSYISVYQKLYQRV